MAEQNLFLVCPVGRPLSREPNPSYLADFLKLMMRCWYFVAVLHISGCGSLPSKPAQAEEYARTAATGSFLAGLSAASLGMTPDSGFRLISNPGHALDARVELIRRAEQSVDVQYYYIANDKSGRGFLYELQKAAQRGVRVRLLVDDLHTAEINALLLSLAGVENLQVRLFNPFCCVREGLVSRFIVSIFDLRRLNRRMHNKLMIVDGVIAVTGGRNIADAYFSRHEQEEFLDLDMLMAGAVVSQLNVIFTRYWNSEQAWDAKALSGERREAGALVIDAKSSIAPQADVSLESLRPLDLLGQRPLSQEMSNGKISFSLGTAYAIADTPGKVLESDEKYLSEAGVTTRVWGAFETARQEVMLSSPYFIPGVNGMRTMDNLSQQGIRMVVLTNSLATNDSIFAHAGYARYRKQILRLGVELYELKSSANVYANLPGNDNNHDPSLAGHVAFLLSRLHAKTAVIDKETVYIGSMNLDPRSSRQNTELGLLIESPELAQKVLSVLETVMKTSAFSVRLSGDGRLGWTFGNTSSSNTLHDEPQASFRAWLQNFLLAPLIPESLL